MKTLIIIVAIIITTTRPVVAMEYEINGDHETDKYNYEDYLPQYVKDILNENGGYASNGNDIGGIIDLLFVYFKEGVDKYSEMLMSVLCILMLVSIIKRIIDNSKMLMIVSYLSIAILSYLFLGAFASVCELCASTLSSLSEILTVLLPAFTGVTIMCGGTLSSITASASFAAVLTFLEIFLSGVVQGMVTLLVVLSVFERVSPVLGDFDTAKTVKKYTVMLLTFITTIMLTVLSYQGIISARADSLSTRTVKFAAANFIPIIGNAVGESLKTVSSGVSYLKSSIGGASALALFFCIFPTICELVVIKITLSFLSFFGGMLSCSGESGYISSCVQVIDIMLSIIICCAVLSFLLVFLFSVAIFG